MESQQKKAELDKKAYDDLVRERDILSKVTYVPHLSSLQLMALVTLINVHTCMRQNEKKNVNIHVECKTQIRPHLNHGDYFICNCSAEYHSFCTGKQLYLLITLLSICDI